MNRSINRRRALQTSLAAGVGFWMADRSNCLRAESPNEKLNLAFVGLGGQGKSNLDALQAQNVVALCDVDQQRAGTAYERFPSATRFEDYRRMFDTMANQIDGVVVSTPDHTHFHPAMAALQLGKHLYCEKPMAHSVWEIRTMTECAAKMKVATQLGVQRHTLENVHRVVELIQSGAIGRVTDCHCWISGSRGMPDIPTAAPAVPDHLNWDLWIGPARPRPYSPTICPYGWRFWWDYGTGETGNWGCHILDIPFWALGLRHPSSVEASGPPVDPLRSPKSMSVKYVFQESDQQSAVNLYWYHAEPGPPVLTEHGLPHEGNNTLFIGTEGMLLCGFSRRRLYPEEKFRDAQPPERSIPDSPGFRREWVEACKGGTAATCDFAYSGPLSETVILGNVAYRSRDGFQWSAQNLDAVGSPAAQQLIKPEFRSGWEFDA